MKDEDINDLELFPLGKITDVRDIGILYYRLEKGENVRIVEPQTVAATHKNHIVTDSRRNRHEIPRNWLHIIVKNHNGDEQKVGKSDGEILVEKD